MRSVLRAGAVGALIVASVAALAVGLLAARADAATDGSYQDVYHVHSCLDGSNAAPIFSPSSFGFMTTANSCLSFGGLEIDANGGASKGNMGQWAAQTPAAGMRIIGVIASGLADCNLHKDGYAASYFYGDLGVNYAQPPITVNCNGLAGNSNAGYLNQKIQSSRYFGWHVTCTQGGGCPHSGAGGTVFLLQAIDLEVQDTTGPTLNAVGANNLYYQSGWVRGQWSTDLSATDPSGICSLQTAINGTAINTYIDWLPDTSNWSQCPGNSLASSVDTSRYPDGPRTISLRYYSSNAAGAASTATHAINVDNAPVGVSLAGPTDAFSTAGTQYVTATATAGPSGAHGIHCSIDGASDQFYPGASAKVPVSGIGTHQISCYAQNNAVDSSGAPGTSPAQSFDMQIRQPTAAAISFGTIKNALRCARVKVKVQGKSRVVKRHGKRVTVRTRAHLKTVLRCHARTVRRKVTVIEHRHGRTIKVKKVRRVVLLPHTVNVPKLRVAHGHGASVSGFLLLANGTALPGRTIRVLTAPDNGLGQFTTTTTATTTANGSWSAKLPRGPSRLVEAVYAGDGTTEPTTSSTVSLTVPANLRLLSVTPRVAWGGTVRIVGQLAGGYFPPGGALVRLRIGQGRSHQTFGVLQHVTGNGRFSTTYTFGLGPVSVLARYFFSAQLLATGNYPFASATSERRYVMVGGHPHRRSVVALHHRHHHH